MIDRAVYSTTLTAAKAVYRARDAGLAAKSAASRVSSAIGRATVVPARAALRDAATAFGRHRGPRLITHIGT